MGQMFGFLLAIILIGIGLVAAVLLGVVKMFRGPAQKDEATEEARIIQEMYNTMNRLEDRVESLETILMEQERKE